MGPPPARLAVRPDGAYINPPLLATDLPSEPERAFADLVYAVETSLGLGLTGEAQILPAFRELYALRHRVAESSSQLVDMQHGLRSIIAPDGIP